MLYQAGDLEGAKSRFNMGFQLDEGNAPAHYYMAETLKALGDVDKAKQHYEETARLGPDVKEGIMAGVVLKDWGRLAERADKAQLVAIASKITGEWCGIRTWEGSGIWRQKRMSIRWNGSGISATRWTERMSALGHKRTYGTTPIYVRYWG